MTRLLLTSLSVLFAGMCAQTAAAANSAPVRGATSMAAAQRLHEPANFDASLSATRNSTPAPHLKLPELIDSALFYQRLRPAALLGTHFDKILDKPTFIRAGKQAKVALDFSVIRKSADAPTWARAYLRAFGNRLEIGAMTVNSARLVFLHDDGTGPVIARFQQVVGGLDVANRQLNVIMDQDLNLIAISGYFATVKGADQQRFAQAFYAGPQAAINAAFKDLDLPLSAYSLLETSSRSGGFAHFAQAAVNPRPGAVELTAPVGAKKVLFPIDGKLLPGYLVTVQAHRPGNPVGIAYAYVATADGRNILFRKNLVNRVTYTYRVFADASTKKPYDSPAGNDMVPYNAATIEVLGAGNLVAVDATHGLQDAWLPIPDSSFPTDQTQGNNVWTYLDVAGADGQDDPADKFATVTASNAFDYAFDFTIQPTLGTNQLAAVVQLFYLNNWLHDAWYEAGFTEATGNAQYSNYGRGGAEGDPILGEAQDFSGMDNANMATPPDGGSPRQQMYLWTGPIASQDVTVTSTGNGNFVLDPAYPSYFGPQNYSNISGALVIYNDGDASGEGIDGELDACQATQQDLTGKIALIADIYTCNFTVKIKNAQNAGAVAALVVWNGADDADAAFQMGGSDGSIVIPSLGVSDDDADPIIAAIQGGDTVSASLSLQMAPNRDGSLDTQIVAHEFFHYVSNRLVGDALGLSNVQGGGMGEGWSDMASLFLTARADDLASNPDGSYAVGGFAIANYGGLRFAPYTTDMAVNPLTFNWITQNPEVHFVGTVWTTALWEAFVGLYKHYAAIDPATAYDTTRTRMMNYIIEGLMATPDAPTMIEARDAILIAAQATDATDYDLLVTAFAKRGFGFGAVAPPRDSSSLEGVTESYKTALKTFIVQDAQLDVNAAGVCDADYSLDPGETGEITLTLKNTGSADLDGVTAQLSSASDIVFANNGKLSFSKLDVFGGEATATITALVQSATTTSEAMTIEISFPDVGTDQDDVIEADPITFQFTSNQDFKATKSVDDVENTLASLFDWTRTFEGSGAGWSVDSQFSAPLGLPVDNQYWYGPDNGSPSNIALVTPPIKVGNSPFEVSFYHYFQFEDGAYDGGVVEITSNGGTTWTDVTQAGGTFKFGYTGQIGPYNEAITPGSPAFVNIGGTVFDGAPEAINFGTALAGKTVQLRFRVGSDAYVGEVGWIIDDITVTGATEPMFSTAVAEDNLCVGQAPVADAGSDQTVEAGAAVTLNGSGSSDAEGQVTYAWTQTGGPATVSLTGADTAQATFTAPSASGTYTFDLTVTDQGGQTDADTASVTVQAPTDNGQPDDGQSSGGGGSTGLLALFGLLGLLGLGVARRRHH